MRPPWG